MELAKITESDGDISTAADILQELQVRQQKQEVNILLI